MDAFSVLDGTGYVFWEGGGVVGLACGAGCCLLGVLGEVGLYLEVDFVSGVGWGALCVCEVGVAVGAGLGFEDYVSVGLAGYS